MARARLQCLSTFDDEMEAVAWLAFKKLSRDEVEIVRRPHREKPGEGSAATSCSRRPPCAPMYPMYDPAMVRALFPASRRDILSAGQRRAALTVPLYNAEATSLRVYSDSGLRTTVAVSPRSTIAPDFITSTLSHMNVTTGRSWVTSIRENP